MDDDKQYIYIYYEQTIYYWLQTWHAPTTTKMSSVSFCCFGKFTFLMHSDMMMSTVNLDLGGGASLIWLLNINFQPPTSSLITLFIYWFAKTQVCDRRDSGGEPSRGAKATVQAALRLVTGSWSFTQPCTYESAGNMCSAYNAYICYLLHMCILQTVRRTQGHPSFNLNEL